jgi:hypothetical protein
MEPSFASEKIERSFSIPVHLDRHQSPVGPDGVEFGSKAQATLGIEKIGITGREGEAQGFPYARETGKELLQLVSPYLY